MVSEGLCERVLSGVAAGFSCGHVGEYLQIRTPFSYPDGGVIDLYVKENGKNWTTTDLGETYRWLDSQAWSEKRTPAQQELISQIRSTLGVEEFQGSLMVTDEDPSRLADAVTRLAQAASRVADIWFTFRSRSSATIREDVEDFLRSRKISYEREVKREGRSGKLWTLDFETRAYGNRSLVQVLSTESRSASSRLTDHTVAAWVDIMNGSDAGALDRVSLFDDTVDVWKDEDFAQLEGISTVALWSDPGDFARILTA